jgi:hypothetical protein
MALVVDVPLNTMLADLDEALRELLKAELERHGFDGVQIAFDAPARDWSSQLSSPTVNLFLYDLREATEHRPIEWERREVDGRGVRVRPPLVLECSYAVTGWTQAVEDEHRLLSQVLSVLFAFPELPVDRLPPRLAELAARHPISGSIGQPKADGKADFWSAVGGQYKPSLDYVVRIACESGTQIEPGPEVRSQTLRMGLVDGPARSIEELHRFGGTVSGPGGEPLGDVWIALPELGVWTASRRDGRFVVNRVQPGRHRVLARTADGNETEVQVEVPGPPADVVIGGRAGRKKAG